MASLPQAGTNAAATSTFRLVPKDPSIQNFSSPSDAIDKLVSLEPFDFPGMAIVHYGEGKSLGVGDPSEADHRAVFRLVSGLNGKDSTFSLESEDQKGCFAYRDDTRIELRCSTKSTDDGFKEGASFTMRKGFSEYDGMSFVAKGMERNFLLSPLLSIWDESYTVYFSMHS